MALVLITASDGWMITSDGPVADEDVNIWKVYLMSYEQAAGDEGLISDLVGCRMPAAEGPRKRGPGMLHTDDVAMTQAPTAGSWSTGDWVKNSDPKVNDDGWSLSGWVCTEGGSPGVWQPMYTMPSPR